MLMRLPKADERSALSVDPADLTRLVDLPSRHLRQW